MIKTEQLTENLKFMQNKDLYTFSSDATNLFNFINIKKGLSIVDLGCGSGVISFLIYDKFKPKKITGVEIQDWAVQLFNQNMQLNNIQDNMQVFHGNIKECYKSLGANLHDVVVCNPPYFKVTESRINDKKEIAISRHQIEITLEQIVQSASKLLKYGGEFYICYPAKQIQQLCCALSQHNFAIKELKFLFAKGTENFALSRNKPAYLALARCTLGGKIQTDIWQN